MSDRIMASPSLNPDANLNPRSPKTPKSPKSPKSPTADRLSLSNAPSGSPKLIAAPVSPVQSITTELDHTPLVSPRSSIAPDTFASAGRSQTINHLEAPDSEDEVVGKVMSDCSAYPEGSDVGIKSPMFRKGMRTSGSKESPAEPLFLDTAGSGPFSHSAGLMTNGSTTAITPQVNLQDEQGSAADAQRKESSDSRISDVNELAGVVPAVVPEAMGDSPTLGSFPMTMMVEPPRTPTTKPLVRNWSTKAQRSLSPIEDAAATTSTDPRAGRVRHMPFLPKFLRLTSDGRDKEEKRKSNEVKKGNLPEVKEEPKSFFNSDSSDDEEEESPVVVHAKHASISRPAVVDHSPSRLPVGSRDMRRGRQRLSAGNNPGPSRAKAARFLGEDMSIVEETDPKRGGVVGTPPATEVDVKDADGAFGSAKGLDTWKHPAPNFTNGLRMHPVQPAVPEKSSRRKVSFPLPPLIEVKPEHRFLRQSIVSTPYPPESPTNKEGGEQSSSSGQAPLGNAEPKTILTLVLYSHGNRAPRIKKVVIPDPQELNVADGDEKGPQYKATLKIDFDDETLFNLIRTNYAGMRGPVRTLASARSVHSLKLVSYTALSQLAARHAGPVFRWTLMGHDGVFAEQKLLDLYTKPRLGRSKHDWTEWVKNHSSQNTDGSPQDGEQLALEITEGWCLPRISFAVTTVLVLSLAATLLWTFKGSKVTLESAIGDKEAFREAEVALRGRAGDRLEAGVALGMLVLMFGWTGIGAWVLLSWVGT